MRRSIIFLAVLSLVAAAVTPAAARHAPNDPDYPRQWGLQRIAAPDAWHHAQGEGVIIAIVDTGVNASHPDLAANMHPEGYDFIDDDDDPADVQGHGTAVAGVAAAATGNGIGMAGTAPKAKIMAVRVGGRDASDRTVNGTAVQQGIMWAVDNGAQVINLSLGSALPVGGSWDAAVAYAVARGAVVVASAGNSTSPYCGSPSFNPLAICVGASDLNDRRAEFSSFGVRLDVMAPGEGIYTTAHQGLGYQYSAGTSLSAPFVSGIAALLLSMGANNVQAAQIIRASAHERFWGTGLVHYGLGMANARSAVQMCLDYCDPSEIQPPDPPDSPV